ncbi:MAG: ACP S-malonyltransferase [Simkaniaceae bacterium]|nr:ACP S-malonyltransferase [Simkaniaceae bacterium]
MSKVAFIFPGQGAQIPGMGKDFFDAFEVARDTFLEADEVLGEHFSKLIFEGDKETLSLTKYSQLAIFITSMAIFRVISQQCPGLKADVMGGLSLGEYTALCASGRISFADCVKLVALRGKLMHEASVENPGTMAAIIGSEVKDLPEGAWVSIYNCPGQTVVAGTHEAVSQVQGKRVVPLDVSGAFHTKMMDPAKSRFAPAVESVNLIESDIGFVSNSTGKFASDLAEIRKNLIDQVVDTVRWEENVRAMMEAGVELFIEIGPGRTLAGMNRKIGAGKTHSISTVEQLEKQEVCR